MEQLTINTKDNGFIPMNVALCYWVVGSRKLCDGRTPSGSRWKGGRFESPAYFRGAIRSTPIVSLCRLPTFRCSWAVRESSPNFKCASSPEIRDETALQEVCRAIQGMKDAEQQPLGLKAQTTNQFVATATEARLGSVLAWATSAIVLALAFLGMFNTMLMSVLGTYA